MQYQERINISQPQEVRHHQHRDRRDLNAEKTAINNRGDYADAGAINDRRLCQGVMCP